MSLLQWRSFESEKKRENIFYNINILNFNNHKKTEK